MSDLESSELDLGEMFRDHLDAVWRTAVALGADPDAAHDVVQEVFMTAHDRLHSFDRARSPRAWLLGITRNVVRHLHRGDARRKQRERRGPRPVPFERPGGSLERAEASAVVDAFLQTLPEKKRVVFVLAFIEGMRPAEIADMLGVKVATVYARAKSAEKALAAFVRRRQMLEEGAR